MATYVKESSGHVDGKQAWQTTVNNDDDLWSLDQEQTPVEHGGLVASIVVFVAAFFLLAIWAGSQSSFEKCVSLPDVSARLGCYEKVRLQEFQPPAKGASMPAVLSR